MRDIKGRDLRPQEIICFNLFHKIKRRLCLLLCVLALRRSASHTIFRPPPYLCAQNRSARRHFRPPHAQRPHVVCEKGFRLAVVRHAPKCCARRSNVGGVCSRPPLSIVRFLQGALIKSAHCVTDCLLFINRREAFLREGICCLVAAEWGPIETG